MKKNLQRSVAKNLLLFLIAVGSLISCKQEQQNVYLNTDFKKYFDYQPGSYWIFYDSLNNYTDSLSVIAYTDKQVDVNASTFDETVSVAMQDFYLDSVANGGIEGALILSAPYGSKLIISQGYNGLNYGLAYNMPFDTGKAIVDRYTPGTYTQTTLFPHLNMRSTMYNNVYQIIYYYDSVPYLDTIYFNEDNGFIAVLLNDQYFHKKIISGKGCVGSLNLNSSERIYRLRKYWTQIC